MLVNNRVRSRTFTVTFQFWVLPSLSKMKMCLIQFLFLLFSCELEGRAKISFKQDEIFILAALGCLGFFLICFFCKVWMNKESLSERQTWIVIKQVWCSLLIQATELWGFLVIKLGSEAKANVCKTIVKYFKTFSFFFLKGDPRRPYPTDLEMRSGLLGQMNNPSTNGVNGHLPGDALAAGRLPGKWNSVLFCFSLLLIDSQQLDISLSKGKSEVKQWKLWLMLFPSSED